MRCLVISWVLFFLFSSCSDEKNNHGPGTDSVPLIDSTEVWLITKNDSLIAHRLDTFYRNFHKRGFNGCVLVARGTKVLYKKAFGVADKEKNVPLTTKSSFQLASVSKTFTATAILKLVDEGKLKLDDKISKYFPAFPYPGITVRHLLTHRSGMAEYMYFCEDLWPEPNVPMSNADVLELIEDCRPDPYRDPDLGFGYCNTNYCILASLIEKISGKSYHQFLNEKFFKPLGMKSSWAGKFSGDQKPVKGYYFNWKPAGSDYLDEVVGDKSVYSSVEDMFRWSLAFYSDRLLSPFLHKQAFTGTSFEKPGKRNYGFGWRLIYNKDSVVSVFHNGEWNCFNTVFYRKLKEKITVVVLSNRKNRGTYFIAPVLEILSGSVSKEETEELNDQ